jgi:tetratricopeptide (TPR) repeat protein
LWTIFRDWAWSFAPHRADRITGLTRPRLTLVGVVLAALIVAALAWWGNGAMRPAVPRPGPIMPGGAPQTTDEAIAQFTKYGDEWQGIANDRGNDPLALETVANARLGVARLTGDYAEYARAEMALAQAFALSPAGSGPHHSKAGLELALHRLSGADAALEAITHFAVADAPAQQAEQEAMRGDVLFYRGDNRGAMGRYKLSLQLGGGPSGLCRISLLQWRVGETDNALRSLDKCESAPHVRTPQFAASIEMQRGIIELGRGDWPAASAHFAAADRIFPGDWRVSLKRALMQAAGGDTAGAAKALEALAVPGLRPEVADSLANLYRLTGDGVRSRAWADKASAIWKTRLAQFPEATWGHARDHELAFGDRRTALTYAQADARNRPYGEALIGLARAWMANSRPDLAIAVLDKARATLWRSVELERVSADALALAGRGDEAEAAREAALAIDPRALDPARGFIWIDH